MGGEDQYSRLGVDSRKGQFGKMFTAVAAEEFPHAFCKIYIDKDSGMAVAQHGDGVGSKTVKRYLNWRETGNASAFWGDVDDCVEMNMGDIVCAGLYPVMFTDNVAVNKFNFPKKEYLAALNERFEALTKMFRDYGLPFTFAGGETADLPDQVRTCVFDGTVAARAPRDRVITCEKIAPGDIIMGVMSGGFCGLESTPNSGIMSNGLTLAGNVLLHKDYNEKYPETVNPTNPYTGRFLVTDTPDELGNMTVGEALTSPTRHFSIIVHELIKRHGDIVHGIVMNTGGGQTKCTRVGKGIRYVKDSLPVPDGIFRLIQEESGETTRNMYQTFNMGIGLDVIGPPEIKEAVREVAGEFGVACPQTGYCEDGKGKNSLIIALNDGEHTYEAE